MYLFKSISIQSLTEKLIQIALWRKEFILMKKCLMEDKPYNNLSTVHSVEITEIYSHAFLAKIS